MKGKKRDEAWIQIEQTSESGMSRHKFESLTTARLVRRVGRPRERPVDRAAQKTKPSASIAAHQPSHPTAVPRREVVEPGVSPATAHAAEKAASRGTRHREGDLRDSKAASPIRRVALRIRVGSRRFQSFRVRAPRGRCPRSEEPDRPERRQVPEEEHRRPHEERGGRRRSRARLKNHVSQIAHTKIKINSPKVSVIPRREAQRVVDQARQRRDRGRGQRLRVRDRGVARPRGVVHGRDARDGDERAPPPAPLEGTPSRPRQERAPARG